MDENHDYPSISQAVGLMIWFFFLTTVLYGLFSALDMVVDFPLIDHPATLGAINLIAIGLVLMIGLNKSGAPFAAVFPFVPIQPSLLFPMAITIAGASILLSEMDNLLRIFLPAPAWFTNLLLDLVGAKTSMWGSIFAVVIVAPLTEELLFRGLVLRGFLRCYRVPKAVIASSILFALLHLNPWQFIGGTVLGALFAWWFIQTRSLIPCLFGHAVSNALPLAFSAIFHLKIRGYTSELSHNIVFQPFWFDALGFLLVGVGVWALVQMCRGIGEMPRGELSNT
ncbi:MAG: type II CAAX endopeptidase family protein [Candidatus Poribacteria bacterium]|nr:type II CAAX endopeptidase family protein [Candidatus Poribacteria bacterium]